VGKILPQIDHIIVLMLENRSLDNLCGWLYSGATPSHFIPQGSTPSYDGVNAGLWNPSNSSYFQKPAKPAEKVFVVEGASSTTVPNPDPQEEFNHITYQLYGPQGSAPEPSCPMQGFVVDYESVGSSNSDQIMQCYAPDQVPVMSALAKNFAISDRWFCSTPNQTWPNRCFVHAGTANGNVNNGEIPDPFDWDVPTIFNVLESMGKSWTVYSDTLLTPSLTRSMFPKLWDPFLDGHFQVFPAFKYACANGSLPSYSFIEPSFLVDPNDEHPPHDITAGEVFLYAIWEAVSQSPSWSKILLVITFDEHGGCYDHVLPPTNAVTPDQASNPGAEGFTFNRFGVRVPTILVSPYIEPGTVFRAGVSDSGTPYDHTSILATIRDWLAIPETLMLPSKRIVAAPSVAQVLTRTTQRPDLPTIPSPATRSLHLQPAMSQPLNDLQRSLLSASARRFGLNPSAVVQSIRTRQDAENFFKQRASMAAS
jgi:phospholipase C